jgi:hypothetical protein
MVFTILQNHSHQAAFIAVFVSFLNPDMPTLQPGKTFIGETGVS